MPFIVETQAFGNGSPSRSFNPNHNTPEQIENWYTTSYGTHDWIAEAALDAILGYTPTLNKWIGEDDNHFWTVKRKCIFLIGTEVPDVYHEQKFYSDGRQMAWVRITLDNQICSGRITHPLYQFKTNDPNDNQRMKPTKYTVVFRRVQEWTYKVKKFLREGKCDAAAFYMGAITHLIADAAHFCHVTRTEDLSGTAANWRNTVSEYYERAVNSVTSDHSKRKQYFTYPNFLDFTTISIDPDSAIRLLSFDVRWDYRIDLWDYYNTPYPIYVQPGPKNASQLIVDYVNDCGLATKVENWPASFKQEAQEHLNKAVEYNAAVINYFADVWAEGDDPKSCNECDETQTQDQVNIEWRKIKLAIFLLMALGVANALLGPLLQVGLFASAAA